jgi:hypothetical protein
MKAMGAVTGMDAGAFAQGAGSPEPGDQPAVSGPSSVLLYGDGFGAIALAQTKTTRDLEKQLEQLRQTAQILGTTTIGGVKAQMVGTPLGGAIVWQQGGTTLFAAGMVPMSDLEAFAGSVR